MIRCSTATVGDNPVISSTVISLSTISWVQENIKYRLRPSSYNVSNARLDFPLPDTPVITVSLFLGIVTSICRKLWILAPFISMFCFMFISKYSQSSLSPNKCSYSSVPEDLPQTINLITKFSGHYRSPLFLVSVPNVFCISAATNLYNAI